MDSSETRFDLWHIPSSTRILSTERMHDVVQFVTDLIIEGIPDSHLMLQAETGREVPARQWVGHQLRTFLSS